MAEKYGTIPKKFTPEWWEYFWMYYKVYVIVGIFILITGAVTVYQILSTPKYDITITYAGNSAFTDAVSDKVMSSLSPMCKDVDKNGKKALNFTQINLSPEQGMEYASSMQSKLFLSLSEKESYIYILDEATAKQYIKSEKDSSFAPLGDWYKGEIDESHLFIASDGTSFGVKLTECAAFQKIAKETGTDFSGNYLFLRYYPREDQIEKQLAGYKAAAELAAKLITG